MILNIMAIINTIELACILYAIVSLYKIYSKSQESTGVEYEDYYDYSEEEYNSWLKDLSKEYEQNAKNTVIRPSEYTEQPIQEEDDSVEIITDWQEREYESKVRGY